MKHEVEEHSRERSMIKGSQHRFRQGRLRSTNLLEFFEDITAVTDKRNTAVVVHLVFQKAFEKNPHQRLMARSHRLEGKNRAPGTELLTEQANGSRKLSTLPTEDSPRPSPLAVRSCDHHRSAAICGTQLNRCYPRAE